MNYNLTFSKQNLALAAAYQKMNDKGRDVLEKVLKKLVDVKCLFEEGKNVRIRVSNKQTGNDKEI